MRRSTLRAVASGLLSAVDFCHSADVLHGWVGWVTNAWRPLHGHWLYPLAPLIALCVCDTQRVQSSHTSPPYNDR